LDVRCNGCVEAVEQNTNVQGDADERPLRRTSEDVFSSIVRVLARTLNPWRDLSGEWTTLASGTRDVGSDSDAATVDAWELDSNILLGVATSIDILIDGKQECDSTLNGALPVTWWITCLWVRYGLSRTISHPVKALPITHQAVRGDRGNGDIRLSRAGGIPFPEERVHVSEVVAARLAYTIPIGRINWTMTQAFLSSET
jgi:hypothetical protein